PQKLAGATPDRHANPIAMLRPPLQGLQNQQVQRSLQKLNAVLVPLSLLGHRFVPHTMPSMPKQVPRRPRPCRLLAFSRGYDVMTRLLVPSKAVDILPPACRHYTSLASSTPVPPRGCLELLFP